LEEAHPFDISNELPRHGLLSFFYDIAGWPWGGDPKSRDGFRLLWFPDASACKPASPPPDTREDNLPKGEARVEMYQRWCLPDDTDLAVRGFFCNEFDEADTALVRPHIPVGSFLLLGYHSFYEDPMVQVHCQMASKGEAWSQRREDEVFAGRDAAIWRPLLTVSSEREVFGASWGDGGQLMYMMEDAALRRAAFDKAWCIVATT
jgi:uncharacterized protein YwqG